MKSQRKTGAVIFVIGMLLCVPPVPAQAQGSKSVTFRMTLTHPDPACTLSGASALSFGTHTRSGSGSGSRTVRNNSGGRITLTGTDVTSYSVSATLPSEFPNLDVTLSLGWSQSSDGRNWTSMGSSRTYSGTSGGLWSDLIHYFGFWGTATWNWADITAPGSDQASIDITATCS